MKFDFSQGSNSKFHEFRIKNIGSTSHSTTVSGLSNGNTYNYYVRCIDASSNANTNDFAITFSIATPSQPVLTITSPSAGQIISGTTVNANYASSGDLTGVDHVHLQLDSYPEAFPLQLSGNYQFNSVPAGSHMLRGYLATAAHAQVGALAAVSFTTSAVTYSGIVFSGRIKRTSGGAVCASCSITITLMGAANSTATDAAGGFSLTVYKAAAPGDYAITVTIDTGTAAETYARRVRVV